MRRVLAIGLLTSLALVAAVSSSKSGTASPVSGKIAFVQTKADQRSVWQVDLTGKRPRLLTPDPYDDARPAPSRDGKRLFFQSDRNGDLDIWAGGRDGTGAVPLTRGGGDDFQPDPSPDGRRLVFGSERSGNAELWLMAVDGSSPRRLTRTAAEESLPAWSPDGQSIAFTRRRDATHSSIVVRSLPTGRERVVSDGEPTAWGPRWSPDGRRLAWTSSVILAGDEESSRIVVLTLASGERRTLPRVGDCDLNMYPDWSPNGRRLVLWATHGDFGLWTIGVDGTTAKRIGTHTLLGEFEGVRWTQRGFTFADASMIVEIIETVDLDGGNRFAVTSGLEEDAQPDWSPDGRSLAFMRYTGTKAYGEIFLVGADGSGLRNLTRSKTDEQQPSWSPDGTMLAFAGDGGDTNLVDLFTMRADGTQRRNLTHTAPNDAEPHWAVGDRIVFARFPPTRQDEPVRGDIWSIRADGSDLRPLLTGPANDEEPRVSPDGSTIVFASRRDGRFQLYLMNADGSGVRRLVTSSADDAEPDWSPDGAHVVFSRVTAKSASIWLVGVDGEGARKVTDVAFGADTLDLLTPVSPRWQPVTG